MRPRIGILHIGSERWIAGVIYLQNLVGALASLSPREDNGIFVVTAAHRLRLRHGRIEGTNGVVPFGWKNGDPAWRRLAGAGLSIAFGFRPLGLDEAVQRAAIDVLFPVTQACRFDAPVKPIAWIPDFQHLHFPQYWSEQALEQRRAAVAGLIESNCDLVVSSDNARRDLATLNPSRKRVHVLPFVTVPRFNWLNGDPNEAVQRYGLPRKYLMFPSQFWQHKNHVTLFNAIALLRKRGLRDIFLVTTGLQIDHRAPMHGPQLIRLINELGIGDAVSMLGLLSRNDQIQLVRAAAAIVQPSLFEGWSALVEDCRVLGKHLFLSDIPVHREQRPDNAVFFPATSAEALAEAIALAWPDLGPGPDHVAEQRAWDGTLARAQGFATRFLEIVRANTDV